MKKRVYDPFLVYICHFLHYGEISFWRLILFVLFYFTTYIFILFFDRMKPLIMDISEMETKWIHTSFSDFFWLQLGLPQLGFNFRNILIPLYSGEGKKEREKNQARVLACFPVFCYDLLPFWDWNVGVYESLKIWEDAHCSGMASEQD